MTVAQCPKCRELMFSGVDHVCSSATNVVTVALDPESKATLKSLVLAVEDLTDKVTDLASQLENLAENTDD